MKFLKKLNIKQEHKLDFLISFYIFCIVASELMGSKTFPILNIFGFQLNGAVGMFLIPWIFSINDIVAEVYGLARAKNMAKISIFMVFSLVIFSLLAIALPPSTRFVATETAYETIFSQSVRISIASILAMAVSTFADITIFWRLKKYFSKYGLWFRNNLSNLLSILLDTVIFMSVAFYIVSNSFSSNANFLLGVIVPYWLLKSTMSGLLTPVVYLGIKWLKNTNEN
jgi:uncharacterized integral membrane protein (TIGR00697 family)